MLNEPIGPDQITGTLTEEDCQCCDEMCGDKSIAQIRAMGDYFYKKASELQKIAENELTLEDFENVKKQDLDGDEGEGEDHPY